MDIVLKINKFKILCTQSSLVYYPFLIEYNIFIFFNMYIEKNKIIFKEALNNLLSFNGFKNIAFL